MGDFFIQLDDLFPLIGTPAAPLVFDVRRREAYDADDRVLPTARWRDHTAVEEWGAKLPSGLRVVVYCVHGHQVGQVAAAMLRSSGLDAAALAGGIEAWRVAGGITILKPENRDTTDHGGSRWMLRTGPGIEEIGCAWLVRRFLDTDATFLYVAADQVAAAATELGARAVAPPGGDGGSALSDLLERSGIDDAAVHRVSEIVQAAAGGLSHVPEAPGLALTAAGLADGPGRDDKRLSDGFALLDALYAGCRAEAEAAT